MEFTESLEDLVTSCPIEDVSEEEYYNYKNNLFNIFALGLDQSFLCQFGLIGEDMLEEIAKRSEIMKQKKELLCSMIEEVHELELLMEQ